MIWALQAEGPQVSDYDYWVGKGMGQESYLKWQKG